MRALFVILGLLVVAAAPTGVALMQHRCAAKAGVSLCTDAYVDGTASCVNATLTTAVVRVDQNTPCMTDGGGSGAPFEGLG